MSLFRKRNPPEKMSIAFTGIEKGALNITIAAAIDVKNQLIIGATLHSKPR